MYITFDILECMTCHHVISFNKWAFGSSSDLPEKSGLKYNLQYWRLQQCYVSRGPAGPTGGTVGATSRTRGATGGFWGTTGGTWGTAGKAGHATGIAGNVWSGTLGLVIFILHQVTQIQQPVSWIRLPYLNKIIFLGKSDVLYLNSSCYFLSGCMTVLLFLSFSSKCYLPIYSMSRLHLFNFLVCLFNFLFLISERLL